MTQPISVLLVDDNPTFLNIAARFLREHSDDLVDVVGLAQGGNEALELAQELAPQVVLLDLSMPDLPGLELIPLLRENVPETHIIVLTLMDTQGYREAVTTAGADAFIPKAALSKELLPAIQQVVHGNHTSTVENDE